MDGLMRTSRYEVFEVVERIGRWPPSFGLEGGPISFPFALSFRFPNRCALKFFRSLFLIKFDQIIFEYNKDNAYVKLRKQYGFCLWWCWPSWPSSHITAERRCQARWRELAVRRFCGTDEGGLSAILQIQRWRSADHAYKDMKSRCWLMFSLLML